MPHVTKFDNVREALIRFSDATDGPETTRPHICSSIVDDLDCLYPPVQMIAYRFAGNQSVPSECVTPDTRAWGP